MWLALRQVWTTVFLLSPWHRFWFPAKIVHYGNYQLRPFLAFKRGGFAITKHIFCISFSRKAFKWLFLPSSSQEIPEMGNAAIYSVVSSTGVKKVLTEIVLRSCIRSVWAPGPSAGGKALEMICQEPLWWSGEEEEFSGFVSVGLFLDFTWWDAEVTCTLFSVLLHLTLVSLNLKPQGGMWRKTFRRDLWRAPELNTRGLSDFLEACPAVWSLLGGGINTVQSSWTRLCVSLGLCPGFFYVTL